MKPLFAFFSLLVSAALWAVPPKLPFYQLNASQLAVVVNRNDPLSAEIARYYVLKHGLKAEQIFEISLPIDRSWVSEGEFAQAKSELDAVLPVHIQALALAWAKPYRVNCLGITYVFTLGYKEGLCQDSGKPTPASPYFNHASTLPFSDLGIRPSMMLAANNLAEAKKFIDRGAEAWGSFPQGTAYYLTTSDTNRNARAPLFPRSQTLQRPPVRIENLASDVLSHKKDVLIYQTGLTKVDKLETLQFLPGALADHLTSYGGMLTDSSQMSSLKWLEAGATASYGTVSEPYSYPQKFPHPQVLLFHYLAGASAVEAYWKSVEWPAQGVFIGDPLAAPFRSLSPRKQ
ncbi:TIGR03790 family protein [Iodobacter fluviatilis]|uniref:Uncharacterized protein (TIGR03790 family) n=1 Tax=Iodobacter fluviatilis TaxID=537 RepID=A0A377SV79_9NEIS|nr:TIGR03790 family protein [Iodobacter fluviatilis]TCU85078.1 uncharacterized protein (TIGR03790 family) [Iodobacter fluviatilis]STR45238.1 Uncharacterised protein [Iodobacter fluviatilis]